MNADRRREARRIESRCPPTGESKRRGQQAGAGCFRGSGYTDEQLVELLSALAIKTLTNYLDHLAEIEVDEAYQAELR